jgi:hypothetical protein
MRLQRRFAGHIVAQSLHALAHYYAERSHLAGYQVALFTHGGAVKTVLLHAQRPDRHRSRNRLAVYAVGGNQLLLSKPGIGNKHLLAGQHGQHHRLARALERYLSRFAGEIGDAQGA